jgi:predicted nucleotidyltransferase
VGFEEVWKNRVEDEIQGVKVYFASLDDLIKMKKAAGRPKDVEDLKVLRKLKESKEKKL